MSDVHIRIEFHPDSIGNMGKAIAWMRAQDRDFLWPNCAWWHKPPDNARGWIARCLSRFGLRGRLSVERHDGVSAWNVAPPPRWTGFTPSKNPKKQRFTGKKDSVDRHG